MHRTIWTKQELQGKHQNWQMMTVIPGDNDDDDDNNNNNIPWKLSIGVKKL